MCCAHATRSRSAGQDRVPRTGAPELISRVPWLDSSARRPRFLPASLPVIPTVLPLRNVPVTRYVPICLRLYAELCLDSVRHCWCLESFDEVGIECSRNPMTQHGDLGIQCWIISLGCLTERTQSIDSEDLQLFVISQFASFNRLLYANVGKQSYLCVHFQCNVTREFFHFHTTIKYFHSYLCS